MSVEEAVNEAVQAAACLFHNDASSDLQPPNPAKLHELIYVLKAIVDHVRREGSSDDRVMLLSHGPFCLAVIETLVFALRPPQQQSGFAEWLDVLPDISDCAAGLLQAALQEGSREAFAAATVFVHALLRSQVLQAFSRLIAISTAAVGYSLADANPAAAAEAWFAAVQTQSAGAATATPTQVARTSESPKAGGSGLVTQLLMKIASSVVREASGLVFHLYVLSMQLWCSGVNGEPTEAPKVMAAGPSLCTEVTAQLHDSNILEHASRLILVAAEAGRRPWPDVGCAEAREAARWLLAAVASGAAALDDTGEEEEEGHEAEEEEGHEAEAIAGFTEGPVGVKGMLTRTVITILSNALTTLLSVHGTLTSTPAGMIMKSDACAALRAVVFGACFSHVALSGQVVALAALDERTCYGLPEHTALFLRALLLTCVETGGELQDALHDVIRGLLQPSLGNPATSLPAPGFTLVLVRRAGALLASSAKAWAAREGAVGQWGEDCGAQLPSNAAGSTALSAAPAAAAGGAAPSPSSSAAPTVASASAQGQAADDEEVATAQPAARGQSGRVLLARDSICSLTLLAICRLDAALGELTDRDSPRWMQIAAERWHLAVGVAQEAVGWARERVAARLEQLAGLIRIDVDPLYRLGGGLLPADAPRHIGAPLGAGVVPFLLRTFRAAGRCPCNPEALLLEAMQGRSGDTVFCSNLLLFWAYDNGTEAYSLVRSIVKCLLCFERQVAAHIAKGIREDDGRDGSGKAANAAVAEADSNGSSSRAGEASRAGPAAAGAGAGDDGVSGGGDCGIRLPRGMSSVLRVCRGVLVEAWHYLSLSPQVGQPSAAAEQLRRLLSFSVRAMLPPLSRIVRRVAAAQQLAEQQSKAAAASASGSATRSSSTTTTTAANTNNNGGHDPGPRGKAAASGGRKRPAALDAVEHLWNVIEPLLCWLPTLAAACTDSSVAGWGPAGPLSGQRAFDPKRIAARAAGAASAAAADPEGSAIRREGWRRLLLEEVRPLETLGAALRLRTSFPARHFVAALDKGGMSLLLGIAVSGVARGCRQELEAAHRQAGLEAIESALQAAAARGPAAAATPSGVAAGAARRNTTAGVRAGASRASPKAPAAGAASGSSAGSSASGSGSSISSASAARAATPTGTIAQAGCEDSLALWPLFQLNMLEGTLRRCGRTGLAEEVCAVRVARKGLAALEATADGASTYPPPYLAAGLALLPPDVVQRAVLAAGCANPGCINLEGDSERALPLRGCAGCGAVRYCCRECQTAHWQAPRGHKGECHGGPRTVPAGGRSAS